MLEKLSITFENDTLVYSIFAALLFLLAMFQVYMLFNEPTATRYFILGATLSAAFIAVGSAIFHLFIGSKEPLIVPAGKEKEEAPIVISNLKNEEIEKLDELESFLNGGKK